MFGIAAAAHPPPVGISYRTSRAAPAATPTCGPRPDGGKLRAASAQATVGTDLAKPAPLLATLGRIGVRPAVVVKVLAAGHTVGFLSGFFGLGGGFFIVPALVMALGYEMPVGVGTSLLVPRSLTGSGADHVAGQCLHRPDRAALVRRRVRADHDLDDDRLGRPVGQRPLDHKRAQPRHLVHQGRPAAWDEGLQCTQVESVMTNPRAVLPSASAL